MKNEIDHKEEFRQAELRNPIILKNKNRPIHYSGNKLFDFDVIDFSHKYGLSDCLGSVAKYIARAGKKDGATAIQDLEKALDYLQREIKHVNQ